MLFYFKDKTTFMTKGVAEGATWKLVQSIWTDLSEITCQLVPSVEAGDFVYAADGWIGIISAVVKEKAAMSLKVQKIEELFNRDACFTLGSSQPCEWTAAFYVKRFFVNGTDEVYNYRFLDVIRDTLEAKALKPPCTAGVFNVKSYLARIRRLNQVFNSYAVVEDMLTMHIYHEVRPQKTLVTSNVPVEIVEESFGGNQVAKVSTYTFDQEGWVFEEDLTHWYLLQDGTVTNDLSTATSARAEGDWKLLHIQTEDDPEQMARNVFAENSYTHKIIVRVPDDKAIYNFFDPVRVEIKNRVYQSYVSRKTMTSEGYTEYTFGNLKTSLMDKINEEE